MVARKGIHKVRNNTLRRSSKYISIEDINRDYFIERKCEKGSTFLNWKELKKIGSDFNIEKGKDLPRIFFDIDGIDL